MKANFDAISVMEGRVAASMRHWRDRRKALGDIAPAGAADF